MTMYLPFTFPAADAVIADLQTGAIMRTEGLAGGDKKDALSFGAEMALFDVTLAPKDPESPNTALPMEYDISQLRKAVAALPGQTRADAHQEEPPVLTTRAEIAGPVDPDQISRHLKPGSDSAHQFLNPIAHLRTAHSALSEPTSLGDVTPASPRLHGTAIKTAFGSEDTVPTTAGPKANSTTEMNPPFNRAQHANVGSQVSEIRLQRFSKVPSALHTKAILERPSEGYSGPATMPTGRLPEVGVAEPDSQVAPMLATLGDKVNASGQGHPQPEARISYPLDRPIQEVELHMTGRILAAEPVQIVASKGETLLQSTPQAMTEVPPHLMPSSNKWDPSLDDVQINLRETKAVGTRQDSAPRMQVPGLADLSTPATIPQIAMPAAKASEAVPKLASTLGTGIVLQPSEASPPLMPQAPDGDAAAPSRAAVPYPVLVAGRAHTVEGDDMGPLSVEGERRSESVLQTTAPNRATPIPHAPPPFVAQIRDAIGAGSANQRSIEIALKPEELGSVRMTLTASDSGGSIAILVERPETLELVQRHLEALRRELRDAGWAHSEVFVAQDRRASDNSDSEADSGSREQTENGPLLSGVRQPAAEIPTAEGSPIATSGLDLRI